MRVKNFYAVNPEANQAMEALQAALDGQPLAEDPGNLLEYVKLRVSQINGCSFCVHLHTKEAIERGEDPMKLAMVAAWRESQHWFSDRERAALDWAEALTYLPLPAHDGPTDAQFERLKEHFSETEIGTLTWSIGAINVWNRLSRGFGTTAPRPKRQD